jgi:hypothetical protein
MLNQYFSENKKESDRMGIKQSSFPTETHKYMDDGSNELPRSPVNTCGIFDKLWGIKYSVSIRCGGQYPE